MSTYLEIYDNEAGKYFRKLENFLGKMAIDERITNLERELQIEQEGVYKSKWLIPNRQWWMSFQNARRYISRGETFKGKLTPELRYPLKTAVKINHLYSSMPKEKRGEFCSRILTADNLNPIFFEIDAASHFLRLGYKINWCGINKRQGERSPEFIAKSNSREIEVECKTKQIDAGRKIIRPAFYRLVDSIIIELKKEKLMGVINIKVSGRMPVAISWYQEVKKSIFQALQSGVNKIKNKDVIIEINLESNNNRSIPKNEINIKPKHRVHTCTVALDKGNVCINPITISMESESDDRFVSDVFDDLKDANKQFSGQRTAIIFCYIPEVRSFEALKDDSSLKNMTALFFDKYAGNYVSAVVYSSDPNITNLGSNTISENSPALIFRNLKYNLSYGEQIKVF